MCRQGDHTLEKTPAIIRGIVVAALVFCPNTIILADASTPSLQELLKEVSDHADRAGTNVQLRTLPELAIAQAKSGGVDTARATFDRVLQLILSSQSTPSPFAGPESRTIPLLVDLAVHQGKAGMYEERRRTLERALEKATQITDRLWRAIVYRDIAVALARGGEGAEFEAVIAGLYRDIQGKELNNHRFKVAATKAVAEAYFDSGNQQFAELYYSKTSHLVNESRKDRQVHIQDLFDLAMLSAYMGDSKRTDHLFQELTSRELKSKTKIKDPLGRTRDTLAIVDALLKSRQHELASKLIQIARQSALKIHYSDETFAARVSSDIWQEIALSSALLGNMHDAVDASRRITMSRFRISEERYRALSDIHSGNLQAAAQHLKKESPVDLDLLAEVTQKLAHSGDVHMAAECFELLRTTMAADPGIKAHKDFFSTDEEHPTYLETLQAVASARAASGDDPQTLIEWASGFPTLEERLYGLLGVAEGLVRVERKTTH